MRRSTTMRRLRAAVALVVGVTVPAAGHASSSSTVAATPVPAEAASVGAAAGTFGDAADFGSMAGKRLASPIVGIAGTKSGKGYWLVGRDGGIFSFGDAVFHGSTGAMRLNQPIVGMAATPTGAGYWFVAADGGIFSFGDAAFHGSTGAMRLNQPIVGMAPTPSGRGYWLVASDGGIFSFGDAVFHGGTGAIRLNQPITGMSATSTGRGYWLVARDGGVFSFGDARSFGSGAGVATGAVVGLASAATSGYWLASNDGAVLAFGGAEPFGSSFARSPIVGIAATATGRGYWLANAAGDVLAAAEPAPSGSYAFLRTGRDGKPVRYNPCVDVHYVINPALAPPGAVQDVHGAFGRLSAATGIRFVFDGTTTEPHTRFGAREVHQPDRYGDRWAPVLVSWTTEAVEPLLAGGVMGYGGSTSLWSSGSDEAFVTGEVVLDTAGFALAAGFGPGLTRGNLILHELGHVVGLDHVDDRGQLMYGSIHSGTTDGFASGDLAGLPQLGRPAGCVNAPSPA